VLKYEMKKCVPPYTCLAPGLPTGEKLAPPLRSKPLCSSSAVGQ